MIRKRIQNEANDVWAALSILNELTNAKHISRSELSFLESTPVQLFRQRNLTFLFGLAVCHLRLIDPNFDKVHQEPVAKREDRALGWRKQAEVEITKKLKEV